MAVSEIQAATWEDREKKPFDMVTDNIPLMMAIKAAGGVKTISGGRVFWEPAKIAQNGYVQRIDPTEQITLGYQPTLTDFEYSPKIMVVPVVINELEKAQNQGDAQFLDLLDERTEVAESSLMNNVEADLHSDGTTYGGKSFAGIKTYISDTPTTGTYGGVSRVTYSSIRNTAVNLVSTFTGATDSSNIESRLRYVKSKVVRNQGANKYICLAGETYFNAACDSMSAKQRFTKDDGLFKAGFDNVEIEGMTMVLANGKVFSGLSHIAVDRCYIINTDNFKLKMYKGYNFEPLKTRNSWDQLVDASITLGIGQFTCNGSALSAVAFDS